MTCGEAEYSVTGPWSVQVVQDPLLKSSVVRFRGINQQPKHTFKQTHQLPRMEAIVLGGLKSMIGAGGEDPEEWGVSVIDGLPVWKRKGRLLLVSFVAKRLHRDR